MLLNKRHRDWILAHVTLCVFIAVGTFIGGLAIITAIMAQDIAQIAFFGLLDLGLIGSLYMMARYDQTARYRYSITFQKWQDHELPDPRESARIDRMIAYCTKRKIPHRAECYHGVPYRLGFIYEDDLHEANLAV